MSAGIAGNDVSTMAGAVMSWRTRPKLGALSMQPRLHAPAALYWECAFQR